MTYQRPPPTNTDHTINRPYQYSLLLEGRNTSQYAAGGGPLLPRPRAALMVLTNKLGRLMTPWLEDGERVLHAVPAFHLGGARETVASTLRGGGAFAIAASRIESGGTANVDPRTAGNLVELPQRCIVAVTEQRLLIFQNGYWTHKPVKLVAEYLLTELAWVGAPVVDPGTFTKSERVVVGVPGPAVLAWAFPRLYIETGRALMSDLAGRIVGPAG